MLLVGDLKQRTCSGITRRSLLQVGFLGALGLGMPQYTSLAAGTSSGKSVILLWLWGGPPHLDTLDPKPDAPIEWRGPYQPLSTNVPGIQVTELLPLLARRADRYAILRSLHHHTNDHGIAGTVALTGKAPVSGQTQPHVGSMLSRVCGFRPPLSTFVTIGDRLHQGHRPIQGEGGGMLGAVYDPFRIRYDPLSGVQIGEVGAAEGVTATRVERRFRLLEEVEASARESVSHRDLEALRRFYQQAHSLMTSSGGRQVFDLTREPAALRDRYGRHRFGQSCLLARRLVEAGVPFVQVNWSQHVEAEEDAGDGGWDNHYRNFEMLADRQCYPFDQACAALMDDLRDRGLWEQTLVVAMGEFGRTPKINGAAGRDHWQNCYSALLAGGGVRGGQVVGASDARGEFPDARPLSPADVCATILECAGVSRTDVLAAGLPPDGDVIHELF